jgi:transposase
MHAPLTDAEYALLSRLIPQTGRPSPNRRQTLDGIFHVVMSRCIWADMPARFGKPDTAQRQLRRWMRAGVLDSWLVAAASDAFASLRERICRAWRRVARLACMGSLLLAKRLAQWVGMRAALPCAACYLPDPALSESVRKLVLHHLKKPFATPAGWFALAGRLLKQAGGQPRRWRVR